MKKTIYSVFVIFAAFIFAASCTKEVGNAWEEKGQVVDTTPAEPFSITVTIPQDMTKISFEQENKGEAGDKVKLTWDETDELVIVDNGDPTVSRNFIIPPSGISVDGKTATFTMKDGQPAMFTPSNGKYDVLYGAASLEEAQAKDYSSQTQTGNASLDGLENNYIALASGVNTIENVELGKTWAEANGGTFKETGIIRLWLQMPTGVESIASVTLNAPSAIFYKSNALQDTEKISSMKLAFSGNASTENVKNTVTGYLMMPWEDVAFASDTDLSVIVQTEAGAFYSKAFTVTNGTKFDTGCVNAIKISKTGFSENTIFAAGAGTAADPWLIANKVHMGNIAANLAAGETKYFKMVDDVDMDGESWTMLNNVSPYNKLVNFDGNNKTISNLAGTMFSVFKGSIINLTLDGSTVTEGKQKGVFAQYIQGTNNTITNVDVCNVSTFEGSTGNCGGMVGRINSGTSGYTTATFDGCDVTNVVVNGANGSTVGGFIGCVEAKIEVNNCSYSGNTVTGTGQGIGGFVGKVLDDLGCVFKACRVESATIDASSTSGEAYAGGFAGLLGTTNQIKGCIVGTSATKVQVKTGSYDTTNSKSIDSGGFVGINYGTITRNLTVRSEAYVKVTSSNTTGNPLHLGGFIGYNSGTAEYCDATVDMTGLQGQHIGGFAGYDIKTNSTKPGTIDNCTTSGDVTGNNYTGGFIGYVDSGNPTISNNSTDASVSGQSASGGFVGYCASGNFSDNHSTSSVATKGSNSGGFVGWMNDGTMTRCWASGEVSRSSGSGTTFGGFAGLAVDGSLTSCHAEGDVDINSGYCGGFIGNIASTTSFAISKCYSLGLVTSSTARVGGFVGRINSTGTTTIEDSYAVGGVSSTNQRMGGLIGEVNAGTVEISRCYSAGAVSGSFAVGGLIGYMVVNSCTIEDCAAWNASVTPSSYGQTNWSSGALIGVTQPNCHASNNFRSPGMSLTAYCAPPSSDWDHPDIDGATTPLYQNSQTAPFTWSNSTATSASAGASNVDAGRWAYHGKHSTTSRLSTLALTAKGSGGLGWSDTVWDFSADLPTLK